MRCLTIAEALHDCGWRIAVAGLAGIREQLVSFGKDDTEFAELSNDGNAASEIIAHWREGADVLIIDHYGLDREFEQACRGWAKRILVIDDLANRTHDADVLLDQTYGRRKADYQHLVPSGCNLLLGVDYALLRKEFALARPKALANRSARKVPRLLLLMPGSTDPANVTTLALKALLKADISLDVNIVLSSQAANLREVRDWASRIRGSARILVDAGASEIVDAIAQSDFAIGAGGVSTWERACLGLPTLVVVVTQNQWPLVENVIGAGAAKLLGDARTLTCEALADALLEILQEPEALTGMGKRAADLCDGSGLDRVVSVLTAA